MGILCYDDWGDYRHYRRYAESPKAKLELTREFRRHTIANATQNRMLYSFYEYEVERKKRSQAAGQFLQKSKVEEMERIAQRKLRNLTQIKVYEGLVESAPQSLILMIYLLSTLSIDALSIVSICLSMSSIALSIVTSGPQTTSKNAAVS